MSARDPSRYGYLTRLSYDTHTPAFLVKLQKRVAGEADEDDDDEFEDDGSGRPPIPKRPAIPQRPKDDPGSADEDEGDEKPQVVVLKEGKHLTAREAENERRKQKGLPPLPDAAQTSAEPAMSSEKPPDSTKEGTSGSKSQKRSLQFSSSKSGFRSSTGKRKAVGEPEEDQGVQPESSKSSTKKRAKKPSKTLLSFGDDA